MTVTQSSLPARHPVPGTVRNLKCAAGIRVVERLSCFLIQSNMIAADVSPVGKWQAFLVEKLERVTNSFQSGPESRKGMIWKLRVVFFTVG